MSLSEMLFPATNNIVQSLSIGRDGVSNATENETADYRTRSFRLIDQQITAAAWHTESSMLPSFMRSKERMTPVGD